MVGGAHGAMPEGRLPLKIISYNLREHAASGELSALADDHDVDVLCLQEVDSNAIPTWIGHLKLISSTKANRLGLAMYLRDSRFTVHGTRLYSLRKSLHDRVMAPAHERLLAAHLTDVVTGDEVLVGDFHAAPLTATNSLRRKQISSAHEGMQALASGVPSVMVGDFNYPFFTRGLTRRLQTDGYQLTRTNRPTYVKYKIFRGHFDFVTSTGCTISNLDVLPQGASDHLPISLTARVAA